MSYGHADRFSDGCRGHYLALEIHHQKSEFNAANVIKDSYCGFVKSKPTWLGKLLHDDSLISVYKVELCGTSADDEALAQLDAFDGLKQLDLQDTKITDAGMASLEKLSQLEILWLDRTNITDAESPHS